MLGRNAFLTVHISWVKMFICTKVARSSVLKSSDCCDCFDSATVIFSLHLSLHIQCVGFHSHAVNLRQIESAECSHWVGKAINLEMETLSAVKNWCFPATHSDSLCRIRTTLFRLQMNIRLGYRSNHDIPYVLYLNPASVCEHEQLSSKARNSTLPGLTCCVEQTRCLSGAS